MQLTTRQGCSYSVTTYVSWLKVTSISSNLISYSVAANSSSSPRSTTMDIAGLKFAVNQDGTSCAFSIAPSSQSFGASAGTGVVSVTSSTGCSWTAATNAAWITVTGGSSGSGNGQAHYSVAANSGSASRTGTLSIAGKSFTVGQEGVSCSYVISPGSGSVSSSGGTGALTVSSPSGCSWTEASSIPWISILSGAAGSGNGQVSYSVAANSGVSPRSGTLAVAGNTFTVTQTGVNCTFALASTSKSFDGSGDGSNRRTTQVKLKGAGI